FGANNFDVRSKRSSGTRVTTDGVAEKIYPHLSYRESRAFKEEYGSRGISTVFTRVSGSAEIKRNSKTTNPNVRITGGDENYFLIKGIKIEQGRSFSNVETQYGNNVCVVGTELVDLLFDSGEDPLNQYISFYGNRYSIVGVLEKQGSVGGDSGADREIIIPLENARRLDRTGNFRHTITAASSDPAKLQYEMGHATGIMRNIRQDRIGEEDSFEVVKSQSLGESL